MLGEFGPHESFSTPEYGREAGFREVLPEESYVTTLPEFIQLSPSIGIRFNRIDQTLPPVNLMRRGGSKQTLPIYEGEFVTWKSPKHLEEKKFQPLGFDDKKTVGTPCFFTGSGNGFYAYDASMDSPANNFSVIGVDVGEVVRPDGKALLAIAHEMGHCKIYGQQDDISLARAAQQADKTQLPKRLQIVRYGNFLVKALNSADSNEVDFRNRLGMYRSMGSNTEINHALQLFHERVAWAEGLQTIRTFQPFRDEIFALIAQERKEAEINSQIIERNFVQKEMHYSLGTYDRAYGGSRFRRGWRPLRDM